METDLLWNRISCYKNKQANKTNIEKKKKYFKMILWLLLTELAEKTENQINDWVGL